MAEPNDRIRIDRMLRDHPEVIKGIANDNDLAGIVSGQTYIEAMLTMLIERFEERNGLPRTKNLDKMFMMPKVRRAVELNIFDDRFALVLEKLAHIRNGFAHRLGYQPSEDDIEELTLRVQPFEAIQTESVGVDFEVMYWPPSNHWDKYLLQCDRAVSSRMRLGETWEHEADDDEYDEEVSAIERSAPHYPVRAILLAMFGLLFERYSSLGEPGTT